MDILHREGKASVSKVREAMADAPSYSAEIPTEPNGIPVRSEHHRSVAALAVNARLRIE